MKSGPSSISIIIGETIELDAVPRPLVEIITEIAINQGWCKDNSEAREKAEIWHDRTLRKLQYDISILQERGRPPKLAFNSSSDYIIQGACYIEPKDSDDIAESKKRRLRFKDYYKVLRELSPDQFEILCGKLIQLLGVQNPVITRRSADDGIDFYGKLSFESIFFPHDLTPTIQKQFSVWVVGQAKHYLSTRSGTPEIRDLAGAISLGRAGAYGGVESAFHDMHIRVADPVFGLFVTTGSISSNGWRLLERSGIIGVDGEMVAAFLADRGIGLDNADLDKAVFCEWLAS